MGLNFSKPAAAQSSDTFSTGAQILLQEQPAAQTQEIVEVKPSDIVAEREKMTAELVNSPEIDALTSTIDINNPDSILTFGAKPAEEVSKASDVILKSVNLAQLDDTGELLGTLTKIMDKFDLQEVAEEPGFFEKIFSNPKKHIEKILDKYNTLGGEIDKIFVQLKSYEVEIKQSNKKLEQMFEANVSYYQSLVKYILAGEQGCREIEAYIAQRQADMETTGDRSINFEIAHLQQLLLQLEQRTQDLRIAENIAIQSIPMISNQAYSNMNLIRKINSSFIITLPVFKQSIAQAVLLKRQKLQADSIAALDAKTNEMLVKNAQNTSAQSKQIAELSSGSSVKIETLESMMNSIIEGIQETKNIQENARKQRIEDQKRLQAIKDEYKKVCLKQG